LGAGGVGGARGAGVEGCVVVVGYVHVVVIVVVRHAAWRCLSCACGSVGSFDGCGSGGRMSCDGYHRCRGLCRAGLVDAIRWSCLVVVSLHNVDIRDLSPHFTFTNASSERPSLSCSSHGSRPLNDYTRH
jgi:hypothetical protein